MQVTKNGKAQFDQIHVAKECKDGKTTTTQRRGHIVYETEVSMKRDMGRCGTQNCKNGEKPVFGLQRETREVWRQGYAASSETCRAKVLILYNEAAEIRWARFK